MTDNLNTLAPVMQEDRDAAAAYWKGLVNEPELQAMRDGKRDDHWKIQQLARHRLAAHPQPTGDVGALVEALGEAIAVFEGMCDDEIEEELLPRLRQALATAALSAMSPAGEAEQRGYDRAIAEVVAFLRAQADWLAGCDWEEARAYLDVATAIEAGEHKP